MRTSRLTLLLLVALVAGCDSAGPEPAVDGSAVVASARVTVDPTGFSPLTARIDLETTRPVSVTVTVPGRDGPETTVSQRLEGVATSWQVPVFGLYPGSDNDVVLSFEDAAGTSLGQTTLTATTRALPATLPRIRIDVPASGDVAPGMNLVSYFGHNGTFRPTQPFMFDRAGKIRWAFDVSQHPTLSNLFYDDGVEALANGNLYFGDQSTNAVVEIDRFGTVLHRWPFPGYEFHHNAVEKPNGNFLVTVSRIGDATVEDRIIEIDRASGAIVNTWDLRQSLQYDRRTLTSDDRDWVHVNAVYYDPTDDTIVVSGRTQGLVKLTRANTVVWILGAHRGWGRAGDGTDLSTRLLQPLDAAGRSITDPAVLDGTAAHPDFEWNWYQHAPLLAPDGTVMLFDNGDNRQFSGVGPYSRAVAFRIDPTAMTVRQVWQYGKERGAETFSRIVSDVDFDARTRNVLFAPGAVGFGGVDYGKVIEVDYDSKRVLFEATVFAPIAPFGITMHRVERVPMYPQAASAARPAL